MSFFFLSYSFSSAKNERLINAPTRSAEEKNLLANGILLKLNGEQRTRWMSLTLKNVFRELLQSFFPYLFVVTAELASHKVLSTYCLLCGEFTMHFPFFMSSWIFLNRTIRETEIHFKLILLRKAPTPIEFMKENSP